MPDEDGLTPGGDDDATKQSDKNGNAAGQKAGDKSKNSDSESGDAGDKAAKPKKEYTDDEINAIVQRRLDRERKADAEKAKLTKEQQLEKERDDALKLVAQRDLKDDFVVALKIDAGKAGRLFKMYQDDIETDEKGKALNMADVVKSVKADFPNEFRTVRGNANGGDGNGDRGSAAGSDMNRFIRQATGRK